MGASKRCFGVRGVLRNPFGVTRSHLEAFEANWKKKFEIHFLSCFYTLSAERNGIVSACTVVCMIEFFFDSKFWFFLNIFLSTSRMVVIFLRLRKAMLGGPCRYLEDLHTTAEKFSSVTLKKVFGQKVTFSNIFIRIFWELDTL